MYQDFQEPPFQGGIPSPSNGTSSAEQNDPSSVLELVFQHIVDCSIECPSPFALSEQEGNETETRVSVDVLTGGEGEHFQVVIVLRIEMMKDQKPGCIIELKYAGYFIIKNEDEDMRPFLLYVNCPNMLWPSVRHWVRIVTLECGLPGLQLNSVDFTEILRKKIKEAQQSNT
ncbi:MULTISPECIES: protein-export chaperone SecB [Holospora]|uniref:Protein-export protein SecB n=2 Tax=Holospora TaxID=44747 RepID=A0A061JFU4_9PROT|nr:MULTISPECIES: protein-export chaperone SecB [Holospora]ETZ04545.1 protein-export protein SecB [Holospora undulata HU1]GAJ46458.1 protein-export protein SecB [Holospora elegans E1]